MNMHGFIAPMSDNEASNRPSAAAKLRDMVHRHRMFLLLVVLPTLLVAGYYYLIAANQYQSEAHFVVRSAGESGASPSGVGQLLGLAGGATTSQSEAMGVSDYLRSHDSVAALGKKLGLIDMFRRPEADFVSRLSPADPTPERLLRYYDDKVHVVLDRDTGISKLTVRTFRPEDSYQLIRHLLVLGEQRVNQLNQRNYNDAIASARSQLSEAENAVASVQSQMTGFRQTGGDIDPTGTGKVQITMVSTMTATIAAARAQLDSMGRMISHDSPQYRALQGRLVAMEQQLAEQSAKLTGGGPTIARNLGGYEDLKIRQDFVAKRYEAAAANLEKAREQANRQQLYLVRIVDPNVPVKSEYPERARMVLTVLAALLVLYAIGWLLVAGVREHAI